MDFSQIPPSAMQPSTPLQRLFHSLLLPLGLTATGRNIPMGSAIDEVSPSQAQGMPNLGMADNPSTPAPPQASQQATMPSPYNYSQASGGVGGSPVWDKIRPLLMGLFAGMAGKPFAPQEMAMKQAQMDMMLETTKRNAEEAKLKHRLMELTIQKEMKNIEEAERYQKELSAGQGIFQPSTTSTGSEGLTGTSEQTYQTPPDPNAIKNLIMKLALNYPQQASHLAALHSMLPQPEKIQIHSVAPGGKLVQTQEGKEAKVIAEGGPKVTEGKIGWSEILDAEGKPTGKEQMFRVLSDNTTQPITGMIRTKPTEIKPDDFQKFEDLYPKFKGKKGSPEYAQKFESWKAQEVPKTNIQVVGAEARGEAWEKTRVKDVFDTKEGDIVPVSVAEINRASKEEPGRYLSGGAAERAKRQWTYMNEMGASTNDLRDSITTMEPLNNLQLLELGKTLGQHKPGMMDTFISSKIFNGLTTKQQDFAIKLLQTKESAMGMRQVLSGGQGSDLVRQAIDVTLPGILIGDKRVMLKQLQAFDVMLGRLKEGLVNKRAFENLGKSGGYSEQGAPSQTDLEFTAKKYGITVDEVKKRLGVK